MTRRIKKENGDVSGAVLKENGDKPEESQQQC